MDNDVTSLCCLLCFPDDLSFCLLEGLHPKHVANLYVGCGLDLNVAEQ